MSIHPTAIIDRKAEIGKNNKIGPYAVIESGVIMGDNNTIGPGTVIAGNTIMGNDNDIHGHVYIGNIPQDLSFKGGKTYVKIGNNNTIREFTTIHRGTEDGSSTVLGDDNYLMVATHMGHNTKVYNHVIMVNAVSLAGFVEIYDHAYVGAFTIVHQFVRIGSHSVCGMLSKPAKDVPPFMMVDGNPALVRGINSVGLKRKGFNAERRERIKWAYKTLYRSGFSVSHSLSELKKYEDSEDMKQLIDFINNSTRGILLKF
ncbi:MAG TPA: acyl-ACP--UDP-N-acetylglucosamine O-acyltransferase [Spirochaetes bacterium]|nr:acyl-ACP--UDP-N-acetylglucosamine O-acyltransferase [Spirochaetota bacterium]